MEKILSKQTWCELPVYYSPGVKRLHESTLFHSPSSRWEDRAYGWSACEHFIYHRRCFAAFSRRSTAQLPSRKFTDERIKLITRDGYHACHWCQLLSLRLHHWLSISVNRWVFKLSAQHDFLFQLLTHLRSLLFKNQDVLFALQI